MLARAFGPEGSSREWSMNFASVTLVFTGLLLVVLGLFAAGEIVLVALGVVAMIAGGIIQVLDNRRG
jgi:membrane-bound ClpP family serine protease